MGSSGEGVGFREAIRFERWRNDELVEFVGRSFKTGSEREAAWAMFAHLCNEYPGVHDLVRGRLVEISVSTAQ
jgi:hypothetical protein